jgi:hypothetical protein
MAYPIVSGHRAEAEALRILEEARAENLRTLFTGAKLTWGPLELVKAVYKLRKAGAKMQGDAVMASAKAAAVASGPIRELVEQLLRQVFDVPSLMELIPDLGLPFIEDIVGAFVPVVGTAVTGGHAAISWGQTALAGWREYKAHKNKKDVLPGDPFAAAEALQRVIEREVTKNALIASRLTAKTLVSGTLDGLTIAGVAGAPAFGGGAAVALGVQITSPIVSACNVAAKILHYLFLLARDLKEMRKANKRLADPATLDGTVFDTCPILGCYLLAVSDTSQIVDLLTTDLGAPGWMSEVEKKCKKSIWPLQERAVSLIRDHRLELKGPMMGRAQFVRGDGPLDKKTKWLDRTKRSVLAKVKKLF